MIKINEKTKRITFQMAFPNADSVYVVGDFNNWSKSDSMKKLKNGQWKTDIKLEPGEYQFKYFANNGEWLNDEHAPRVPNNLGSENSIVFVDTVTEGKPVTAKKAGAKKTAAPKKPPAKKRTANGTASKRSSKKK